MTRCVEKTDRSVIVYDDALVSHISDALFDVVEARETAIGGRGRTVVIEHQGAQWVLRHYYRGGLVGRILTDQFLWLGSGSARPCREWDLLDELFRSGLPVPRPVAARYVRRGLFYTADLITQRLAAVLPLSKRISADKLPIETWRRIGGMIARFHEARVNHADLNAHNVQVDDQGETYLLDFDRGRIMPSSGRWCAANLARLQRSLLKISRVGDVAYSSSDWQALRDGYEDARAL